MTLDNLTRNEKSDIADALTAFIREIKARRMLWNDESRQRLFVLERLRDAAEREARQ